MKQQTLEHGTHYHEQTRILFNLDQCEQCGCEVQETNAVSMQPAEVKRLEALGFSFVRVEELPSELCWSDVLGLAVCHDCYSSAIVQGN